MIQYVVDFLQSASRNPQKHKVHKLHPAIRQSKFIKNEGRYRQTFPTLVQNAGGADPEPRDVSATVRLLFMIFTEIIFSVKNVNPPFQGTKYNKKNYKIVQEKFNACVVKDRSYHHQYPLFTGCMFSSLQMHTADQVQRRVWENFPNLRHKDAHLN